jgi:large subunit ribosomal protein L24
MQRVKKGDKVVVIAGKKANKGKTGEVLAVYPAADKVLVQGVNEIVKHIKPSQQNPQGGRIRKEAPIHISNVMLADPKDGKPTRVRVKTLEGGRKVRVAVRSGEQIDT